MDNYINVAIIDIEQLEDATREATLANYLIGVLLESAELNYNKKALTFSDTVIGALLKATAGDAYKSRLNELQASAIPEGRI